MVARRIASRPVRGRKERTPKMRSAETTDGVSAPERLCEVIEIERDNLSKADSVLGCLVTSMEYGSDSADRPYYPDVAQLARELIRQSINGLDSLVLQKRLLRNKIRESLGLVRTDGAYPLLDMI